MDRGRADGPRSPAPSRGTPGREPRGSELGIRLMWTAQGGIRVRTSVREVNAARWPEVNAAGARAFADFLVGAEAQGIVRTFGVEKLGAPLFFPDAGKAER